MLLHERQTVEPLAGERHLEMVAAAGAILDGELARVGERDAEKRLESLGHGHAITVAAGVRADPAPSRRYLPAVMSDTTYVATSRICCVVSEPLNDGIPPLPFVTVATTSSTFFAAGRVVRSGPPLPPWPSRP